MSNLDVNELLKSLDNEDNAFLMSETKEKIHSKNNNMLQKLQLDSENLKSFNKKLKNYRYVEDLSHLKYGIHIRWIRLTNPDNINLTNGGILLDIKYTEKGCNILCKNYKNRCFQFRFDECMIFQKITDQENILLDVLSYLEKN